MRPFSKAELKATVLIFICVLAVTLYNMRIALRRARDSQRRADLGAISNALHAYFDDFGFFPQADNGLIKACKGENFESALEMAKSAPLFDYSTFFTGLVGCNWGEDSVSDLGLFKNPKTYLKVIMKDPRGDEGIGYLYLSNTRRFQIFAYLEGEESEDGYDNAIVTRGLKCGDKICNFGKTYADTPLDRSIEKYEEELRLKNLID